MEEHTCDNCEYNDDYICDKTGIFVKDDGVCKNWRLAEENSLKQ